MAKKATPKEEKLSELKRRVKVLRAVSDRMDPADGYDLREISNWSPQRKAVVTRRYQEYSDFLTAFNMDVMPTRKFRKPERRQALREWAGVDYPSFIDVEYIPRIHLADAKPPKVEWTKKDQPIFRRGPVGYAYFDFNKELLVKDPDREVARITYMAQKMGAKMYSVRNADSWMRAQPLSFLGEEIEYLTNKYDEENPELVDKTKDWRRWLNGIEAYLGVEVGQGYSMDTVEGQFLYGLSQVRRQEGQKQKRRQKRQFERLTGKKYKRIKKRK